jgi:hypothetical protein
MFDCWGPQFPEWEALLRRHKVRLAFFTARAAAEHFARLIPGLKTHWLPEAQELSLLHPDRPLAQRSVHVLEMGRKFQTIHDKIREPLNKAGKTHVYDPPGGRSASAVPGLDKLYERMGDSAVVICYPKTITHPDGAGGVETVTQRYLETIGSGSLVVGHCPRELEDLLGFNPVIELSKDDPAAHLLDVLGSLDRYQPIADLARAKMLEVGGFDARAIEMLRVIEEFDKSSEAGGAAARGLGA